MSQRGGYIKYGDLSKYIRTWHDEKYNVFREPHDKQEQDMILTGGMEKNGILV